jgi:ABC-type sulfate transport system substrate-binding protein
MRTRGGLARTLGALAVIASVVAVASVLSGCQKGGSTEKAGASVPGPTRELTIVAYSIPDKAYKKIIPAFQH